MGRMIQRITRETTSGLTFDDARVDRKVERGLGVVLCRARRWRVQSGMLKESYAYDFWKVEMFQVFETWDSLMLICI